MCVCVCAHVNTHTYYAEKRCLVLLWCVCSCKLCSKKLEICSLFRTKLKCQRKANESNFSPTIPLLFQDNFQTEISSWGRETQKPLLLHLAERIWAIRRVCRGHFLFPVMHPTTMLHLLVFLLVIFFSLYLSFCLLCVSWWVTSSWWIGETARWGG